MKNGATYTAGYLGNGVNFDGTQHADFGNLGSKFNPPHKETIVFRIFPRASGATFQGSDKGPSDSGCCIGQWGVFTSNRFTYQVYCAHWRTVATQILEPNKWYQIAVVIDVGNALKIYVNGELHDTYNELPCNNLFGTFILGARHVWDGTDNIAEGFNGIIDDVRVYNKALNDQQIRALYETSVETIIEPGDLGRIKFNSPSLTKGTHTLKLCTSSMCNTAILTIT